ncbi:transporter substrate-binding domain-containing protein [Amycolatopsis sp., V23-08]|uniref:Transporter substrate-binding domain-containing protein n=1 Tax=Amycolatopsis heterodermiae TaxID=3110235 RepID=A0ABU5RNC4_9PSEU|nr:transporter substrate-binding domain-containing protein [Amycolatopsis sp., V23-08]MEA5367295.1 transporter substrate-binding domain-containing protein [Amycolatopsis sp., V23-08]
MPPGSIRASIAQRGYLLASVDQNTSLFGYRNQASGTLAGFDIDLAHEVAQAISGDPDKVTFRAVPPARRIEVLRTKEMDLVGELMTITCDRLSKVLFSMDYFDSRPRVLVDKDNRATSLEELRGRKVCSPSGGTGIAFLREFPAKPIPATDWLDCLAKLQQHEGYAIAGSDAILIGLARQDPASR